MVAACPHYWDKILRRPKYKNLFKQHDDLARQLELVHETARTFAVRLRSRRASTMQRACWQLRPNYTRASWRPTTGTSLLRSLSCATCGGWQKSSRAMLAICIVILWRNCRYPFRGPRHRTCSMAVQGKRFQYLLLTQSRLTSTASATSQLRFWLVKSSQRCFRESLRVAGPQAGQECGCTSRAHPWF